MGTPDATLEIPLVVSDVTGQKVYSAENYPGTDNVGQLIQKMIPKLNLQKNDPSGAPVVYHARSEMQGRHLNASERVADAVRPHDRLTLRPNVDAGMR